MTPSQMPFGGKNHDGGIAGELKEARGSLEVSIKMLAETESVLRTLLAAVTADNREAIIAALQAAYKHLNLPV